MKNKIILGVIIFFAILFGYCITSEAAIKASSQQVDSGKEFSITVTSDISLASAKVTVTNYSGLTFVTSSGGSAGNGTLTVSKATDTSFTSLATFTFKAPSVTVDTQYTITFEASEMGDNNLSPVPNSSVTATITVKAPVQSQPSGNENQNNGNNQNNQGQGNNSSTGTTKSTNANLSNLGIKPTEYDFHNFKSSKTSYTATVPYEVENVEVWYETADSKATVSISGNENLKVGQNTIKVVVTAESGTQKTYTITVTRKAEGVAVEPQAEAPTGETQQWSEVEKNNTEYVETVPGEGLKSLTISGVTLDPEFDTNIYEYNAVIREKIDSLDIIAEATSESYKIVISGNENLIDGENLITIRVYDEKDVVIAVYQITLMKNTIDQSEVNGIFSALQKEENLKKIGLISVLVLILILIITYIIFSIKMRIEEKKMYEKEDLTEEKDTEKYIGSNFDINKEIETNTEHEDTTYIKDDLQSDLKSSEETNIETENVIDNEKTNAPTENVIDNEKNLEDNIINKKRTGEKKKGKHF